MSDMVTRLEIAAAFTLLVVVVGVAAAVQPTGGTDEPIQRPDETAIAVSATAEVSAAPDLALVQFAVVREAPTADAARERLATNVSSVRAALTEAGVADDDVRTTFVAIRPVYEETEGGRDLTGYRAVQGFEVETAPDQAGAIVDAAVGNGANRVDGVAFTLTERTRKEVRARGLRLAVQNARADADVLADASDRQVTGVRSISTTDVQFRSFDVRVETGRVDGSRTVVEPGPVTVTVTVAVTYEAE